MSTEPAIRDSIERAAESVGTVWPLHSFVTANPLSGFEDRPFPEAVDRAADLFGGRGYPSVDVFRGAWENGGIDPDALADELADSGYDTGADPEELLARMDTADADEPPDSDSTPEDRVDHFLSKWLAAFLDEGRAEWPMPNRERGFYAAFRHAARYDREIPDRDAVTGLPDHPTDAVRELLADHPEGRWEAIFEHHFAALPGWTGFVKHRAGTDGDWQSTCPITLPGYLAVRLFLTEQVGAPVDPGPRATADADDATDDRPPLPEVWLRAWEATYRDDLVGAVADASASLADDDSDDDGRPDAQFVFCIDTRSERIRRHIEAAGAYETHGYAGFFGIPMRHESYGSNVAVDACPPILDPKYRIDDRPTDDDPQTAHDRWVRFTDAGTHLLKAIKSNAATAFSFVENTGVGYGAALAARTLVPGRVYDAIDTVDDRVPDEHEFCEPTVDHDPDAEGALPRGLTLDEKVSYAETAFDLMGWEEFARLVVFAGHASQTANNPYESSLDCGACAGNPGGPNARVLATICNDPAVRNALDDRGFDIPDDTVFVAAEHNTTTDEVTLFADAVPESHDDDIAHLRDVLETARAGAAAERTGSVRDVERRAADWAETRPEWGLAGNAGFVVGPRALTDDLDLDGRAFLHSYDWSTDPDGDALEAILTGPLVVTQWINTQYYFSTVDTAVYGSGSKITHNPVGNVGVYQGNGGDLMTGLPLQSVLAADDDPLHQPLRLSTLIHAPVERVTELLAQHEQVRTLLDNGWLSLSVVDPQQDHAVFHYDGDLTWTAASEAVREAGPAPEPEAVPATPPTADD
ncbi:DUF2309 domain-containing protein [Haloplanus aerogenes]|uniref:Probable inorganic carbon transporter subunit DabA n=1 Tax=Haloplanus aerogenes TaxID=660522 RepID=A0A3M0DSK7_9EURY|nr:DUF2309 domain-containing protein [Haloplanus aerogenes]AZH24602.1 DUF2309 domain-containing protein [Haloplanus aerogenes]RMB23740.1 hypothetical protein ATH50_0970 [Haloplanus aerogenes]